MSNLRAEIEKIAVGRMSVVTLGGAQGGFELLAPGGNLLILLPDAIKETTEGRTVVHGVVRFPMNAALGKESYKVLLALLKSGDITVSHESWRPPIVGLC